LPNIAGGALELEDLFNNDIQQGYLNNVSNRAAACCRVTFTSNFQKVKAKLKLYQYVSIEGPYKECRKTLLSIVLYLLFQKEIAYALHHGHFNYHPCCVNYFKEFIKNNQKCFEDSTRENT